MAGNGRQRILHLTFNQDSSCVLGGMEGGFFTFNTEPFGEATRRNFENGVGVVELLYRSNILALVGGGSCPQWPANKVMLWDDTKRKCVGELSFHLPVKGVRMRKDIIVAVLEKRIFVYNFVDLEMKHSFETNNPSGLCAVSLEQRGRVLAFPHATLKGHLQIEHLGQVDVDRSVTVPAHESDISAIAVNREGSLVASASSRGTLIRIFNAASGQLCYELRRGADRAVIYSLCFNATSTLLACTSDKCTVHIFTVLDSEEDEIVGHRAPFASDGAAAAEEAETEPGAQAAPEPAGASLLAPRGLLDIAGQAQGLLKDKLGNYLPKYFTAETKRSVVRFPVPDMYTICAFGSKPNTILVAGMDGSFSQVAFDVETGAHERMSFGSVFDA